MTTIKQLEERNVASEIILMVWSDKMDLLALANSKGEVALHRLTWTKAWSLSPPKEGYSVRAIAWRPDGKIIAIAYYPDTILLVEVENKNILHVIETSDDVSCLFWVQDGGFKIGDSQQVKYVEEIDQSSAFLPDPTFAPQYDSDPPLRPNLLQTQTCLNLLLIGTYDGFVSIHIFGTFPCITLDINAYLDTKCCIDSIHLSSDHSRLFLTIRDLKNTVKILCFNSDIFLTSKNELFALALKHIKLTLILDYLSNTIVTITESWESILLEMDNKLSNYSNKVPPGGVTADFLELLMFGICSDEMKAFLIHDLTKKGLEKFGQTIEMSYSNIQKLMLKYVMKFGQNVTFHLSEMRGMSRFHSKFKNLGLIEAPITDAILSNGAFLIKVGEMQQIINHSIINYKAYFRWLYTAIVHVLEEQQPTEIPKMTQQDLAYIMEFLQNFDSIGKKFNMERLGQYLNDSKLTVLSNFDNNQWIKFLQDNKCLENNDLIFKHYQQMSLIQQFKHLKVAIATIFKQPKIDISKQLTVCHLFNCFEYNGENLTVSHSNLDSNNIIYSFVLDKILLCQINIIEGNCFVKCGQLKFDNENTRSEYQVVDAKLYTPTILTVLLIQDGVSILSQINLNQIFDKLSEVGAIITNKNVSELRLCPKIFKMVDGMTAAKLAVSGFRKVGVVLAESRRKVRLYEMEAEEEDDDEDMSFIKE